MTDNFIIRPVRMDECELVTNLIKGIAEYEKLSDQVEATPEKLYQALFVEGSCKAVIGLENGTPVGFALYFYNFSTFKARKGLYLEDLFIKEPYRHKGYGKRFFLYLIKEAKKENCGRMEWTCLDWNTRAIAFYNGLKAKPMDEWTIYRLDEKDFERF